MATSRGSRHSSVSAQAVPGGSRHSSVSGQAVPGGSGHGSMAIQTSLFDSFYEEFLKQFMSSGDPTVLSQDFSKLRTDIERTEFLMRIQYIRDFEIKTKAGVKCLEKATRYREEGNKMFQTDKCMEAILFYNKSISYCPHPTIEEYNKGLEHDHEKIKEVQFADQVQPSVSRMKRNPGKYEAIALSYANRSAALRKLNQYEECLRDIARAAKFGYPRENFYKLWDRKGKCYQGLKRVDLAAKCLRQALQCLKESSLSDSQKAAKAADIQAALKDLRSNLLESPLETPTLETQRVLANGKTAETKSPIKRKDSLTQPNVALNKASSQVSISNISVSSQGTKASLEVPDISYGNNPRLQSASSAIDLQFLPEKGRFFIATQDLKPGDVILKEEPYAAVLESVFRVNHCAHCLRKIPTPIPCYQCATVQYCDEGCREISWKAYHYIECGILSYLEPSRCLGRLPHLALRIVTKTGLQNLIQHSQMVLPTARSDKAEQRKQELGQFDSTSYRSVHNLATNTDKRSFEDLIKKTAEAIFMAKCLKSNGFFRDTSGQNNDEGQRAEIFVASLLLRHLQIAATNALEMAECILMNNDITKFDIIPIGGAIFPTMSFFNHSCYPNAMRLEYQNHQVIRVIRNIPKGAELNIDYGFDFYATPHSWRQARASSQYHFTCNCVACSHQWPTYQSLVDKPPRYKKKLTPDLIEQVATNATSYEVAMGHLVKLDIQKAMPLFCQYLTSMFDIIVHPDARYLDCEEAYKQCLWLENRGYKVLKNAPRKSSVP